MKQLQTIPETFLGVGYVSERAGLPLDAVRVPVPQPAADEVLIRVRSYVSIPKQPRRKWTHKAAEQAAAYANQRRAVGERDKQLLRRRGEFLERPFAHLYETGGLRRMHVRGRSNVAKRVLLQAAAFNLPLILRSLMKAGSPRSLADLKIAFFCALWGRVAVFLPSLPALPAIYRRFPALTTSPSRDWLFLDSALPAGINGVLTRAAKQMFKRIREISNTRTGLVGDSEKGRLRILSRLRNRAQEWQNTGIMRGQTRHRKGKSNG
jgi:hypothetical protein